MKKFIMSVVALVAALWFPSSTFASGWDYLGEQSLYSNGAESDVFASTGGDYKICRDSYVGPAGKLKVDLYEYDPDSYNDFVGTRYIERGKCAYFWGIGNFVDGGNEAEFFAKSRTDSNMHLIFFD